VDGAGDVNPDTDQKALALIGPHVKEHHLPMPERCDTARAAWQRLEAVYQAKSHRTQAAARGSRWRRLQDGGGEPLTKYVARARDIAGPAGCGRPRIADQEVAWAVLAGLPQSTTPW
jgi:hypothetical protein